MLLGRHPLRHPLLLGRRPLLLGRHPLLLGWRSLLGWRPLLGWHPLLLGRRSLLLGWRSLLGWRPLAPLNAAAWSCGGGCGGPLLQAGSPPPAPAAHRLTPPLCYTPAPPHPRPLLIC